MNSQCDSAAPWPIETLCRSLLEGDVLQKLTHPRQDHETRDVRESGLEELTQKVMASVFGKSSIVVRKRIGDTLGVGGDSFPGRAIPDIAVRHGGKIHVLELKSSRTDYNRFDKVLESQVFKDLLIEVGDGGKVPWEVEQDLIKLSLYSHLAENVGTCLFVMVDAYAGSGRSWAKVFASPTEFGKTMQTRIMQSLSSQLMTATQIRSLETDRARASLITCVVPPWTR